MKQVKKQYRDFKCLTCGEIITCPKRMGMKTGKGHIKTMWCYNCKEVGKFEQVGEK